MATHADIGNAYAEPDDGALFRRFLGACCLKAGAILTEAANTPNHANRLVWARAVMSQDAASVYARVHAACRYALATNADVQFSPANVTDASISQAVEDALAVLANGS
jgi:hypothetical protein